ncbi:uncharacterized protein TNCT_342681 [Trichonephila clavata]|uniref:Uncharacterized protein n=1 Tax=Trichonephila clavata TaxID=2740835 RepID=A0A8X6HGX2_TRICU|nr:uncharacterized protein TNCT_342681 [Trichonephila clavata]
MGCSKEKEDRKKNRGWATKHFHRRRVGQMKAKAIHVRRLFLVAEEKVVATGRPHFSIAVYFLSIEKEWGRNRMPTEMDSCRKSTSIWKT